MEYKNKQRRINKFRLINLKKPTEYELIFKEILDKENIKYIFQKGFIKDNFSCIVDFYLPKPHKICIEIDGDYHNSDKQKKKDFAKDCYLKSRGFKIIRIKNENVKNFDISTLF